MNDLSKLMPLPQLVDSFKAQCQKHIDGMVRCYEQERDDEIRRAESVRRVLPLLDAAGFELSTHCGERVYLNLGYFPSTRKGSRLLADKLRAIRLLIDVKLGLPDKHLHDAKRRILRFTLRPDDCPGLVIQYDRKLPPERKAKDNDQENKPAKRNCRIVTVREPARTYKSLVCEG